MPDVKEVYEMVTKQKPVDPGALERQRTRQVRTARNRKVGAIVLAAAIGAATIAFVLATRNAPDTIKTAGDPTPKQVAEGFVEAYGSLDIGGTISRLSPDADLTALIGWLGEQGEEGPRDELELQFSLLRAERYSLRLDSCEERGSSASVTNLRCTYAFHALGSDEIGRGPFTGSYFDLIVDDGQISHVSGVIMNIDEFSPQMWEPFAEWVSTTHPEDAVVMYTDDSYSLERVNEESIRLWERNVRRYVEAVQRGDAT